MKMRKAYPKNNWLHRFLRWCRDIGDLQECKDIMRSELDRDRDETESLRSLTVVTVNALYEARYKL